MPQKRCSYCAETKCTSNFHRSTQAKDGLQGYCRPCLATYGKRRKMAASTCHDRVQQAKDELQRGCRNIQNFSDIFKLIRKPTIRPYLDQINIFEILPHQQAQSITAMVPFGYEFSQLTHPT